MKQRTRLRILNGFWWRRKVLRPVTRVWWQLREKRQAVLRLVGREARLHGQRLRDFFQGMPELNATSVSLQVVIILVLAVFANPPGQLGASVWIQLKAQWQAYWPSSFTVLSGENQSISYPSAIVTGDQLVVRLPAGYWLDADDTDRIAAMVSGPFRLSASWLASEGTVIRISGVASEVSVPPVCSEACPSQTGVL